MGGERSQPAAIIMAAGKGTRMNSDLPKVVHPVGGRAMVCAVVDACLEAGCDKVVVVVGYGQDRVREALAGYDGIEFAVQQQQRGTGDAVLAALPNFEGEAARDVFVLAGDGPLIRARTLGTLLRRHAERGASATIATSVVEDPTGYGRIVRDASGAFERIVEQKNATAQERAIREINPSYYCFRLGDLADALGRLDVDAVSGELYLTDVLGLLRKAGKRVEVIDSVPPGDVLSINTPEQLAEVDRVYRSRRGPQRGAALPEGGARGA